ncbi:CPCC family cysteine-rich protein [Streptomyces albipurpureus]|uniref:Hydrolase n=1 Tax=Streptomyces albipurpureus TaxID=2897419 RepID=A0ABT0UIH9_9ACTN|nr:CPCC family cysteine-rich protein [Streptomyces sp. CWNU-1]MCM2388437.1 hydrolase [Streptomyces sp. CWNU-1]
MTSSARMDSANDPDDTAADLAELEALEAEMQRKYGGPPTAPEPAEVPPEGWLPCPCCGHQMFAALWSDEICDVCRWQEDPFQLRYPWAAIGPNGGLSLIEAQANFQRLGAMDERHLRHVRPPADDEPLDPGWRLIDLSRDPFEADISDDPLPDDLTALYWWRPNYWRRDERPAAS